MAGRVFISENSRTALTISTNNVQAKKFPQYVAAILATMAALVGGSFMSWTSPALPLLQKPDSVPHITDEEGSWIGSLLNLGAFLGALPAGLIADKIGRKVTLCILAIPLTGSWLMIAFGGSVMELFAGRFIGGIAIGAVSVATPMYIAELAESSIRGALGTFFQLQLTIGVLFGYLVGLVGDHRALSFISCALPMLFLITFSWMPESPVFLLSKNRKDTAKKALQWLRGRDYDVEDELTKMEDRIQEAQQNKGTLGDLMSSRGTVTALIIALGLMTFQQLSGINAVIFYSGKIFENSSSSLSATTASIIIGVVQVFREIKPALADSLLCTVLNSIPTDLLHWTCSNIDAGQWGIREAVGILHICGFSVGPVLYIRVQFHDPERGGVQRCVRKRLVQSVATLQILRQDDDHEGPAAGENHRRQVRNFILAPLCFDVAFFIFLLGSSASDA